MAPRPAGRCAVLGDPVAHSLSPALHRAGYAATGLEGWTYDRVRTGEDELAGFLAEHRPGDGWRGLSLTMPLKRRALTLATTLTDRARLAGGVNTLVLDEDGLHGDNTDLPGAVAALRERYDGPVTTAVVIGGGATAASIGLAAVELGAQRVLLGAREPRRALDAVRAIGAHPAGPEVRVVELDAVIATTCEEIDLVVSTVPAAAQTPELVASLVPAAVVFEALYDPWPTPLAAARTASGGPLVGGLDLLVHQAVLQFEAFTGVAAPLEEMRLAGRRALEERS